MPFDLTVAPFSAPVDLAAVQTLAAEVSDYLENAHAPATLRAYRGDWRAFSDWCEKHGHSALPAAPETLALYLAHCARSLKVATIQRRIASITQAHLAAGFADPPTRSAIVRKTWKGIRRRLGVASVGREPLRTADLSAVIGHLPADRLTGVRDRALLLLGFAGAMRRSEIVGLDIGDVQQTADGLIVTIRRSKTDQEGAGYTKGIPYGSHPHTCPVRAFAAWIERTPLDQKESPAGPLFRPVDRHGNIGKGRLTAQSVALIVKRAMRAAGQNPDRFAGHSLRSGFATSAGEAGVEERQIMEQTGHRSAAMVRRYIKRSGLFQNNAAARVGL